MSNSSELSFIGSKGGPVNTIQTRTKSHESMGVGFAILDAVKALKTALITWVAS